MPQQNWTEKDERQYKKIRRQQKQRGTGESRAEEIAARTVNKKRAQQGRTRTASRTSVEDKSPSSRGGKRSHSGPEGRTKEQLYQEARRKGVKGRSKMNKGQLQRAVDAKK